MFVNNSPTTWGGGGGVKPCKIYGSARWKIFENTPEGYQNLVLWVCLKFLSPTKWYQPATTTNYIAGANTFLRSITLKGTETTLAADILGFSTLSGTKPQIQTLKGTTNTPVTFIGEYPPPSGPTVPLVMWWWYVHIICSRNIRDEPLEKLWGKGRAIFEPQEFVFVIKFLVWIFLGHSMNIF